MTPKYKSKFSEKEWLEDFNDFVSHSEVKVPEALSRRILNYVHRELHPSSWMVFGKLVAVHSLVGTLSLSICDQFGMSPFKSGFSLSEYFMRFGHSFCMTICGFLFLSLSIFFAWVWLRTEELKTLWKNAWIQIPSIALLSLAAFTAFGAEVVLGIAALWFLGALVGGILTAFLLTRRTIA